MLNQRLNRPLALAGALAVIGGAAFGASTGAFAAGKPDTNARSTNAAGGTIAKVTSVAKASFAATTSAGQKVTVKRTGTTTFQNGSGSGSAKVTKGATVLVLGKVNSTTITATQVVVDPANTGPGTPFTPSPVIAFKRGTQSAAKTDGQVPTDYKEGSGTIVKGTTANKATKAALAAYPGGVIDRVVKLSDGTYEIHTIGVNWPHHIFADPAEKVVGAN